MESLDQRLGGYMSGIGCSSGFSGAIKRRRSVSGGRGITTTVRIRSRSKIRSKIKHAFATALARTRRALSTLGSCKKVSQLFGRWIRVEFSSLLGALAPTVPYAAPWLIGAGPETPTSATLRPDK